jgi:hypothetical protein
MTNVVPMPRAFRLALLADAAASGVTGALLVAGADFLESLLVLPVALMRLLGLSKLTQLTKGEEHACASVVRD